MEDLEISIFIKEFESIFIQPPLSTSGILYDFLNASKHQRKTK